MSNMKNLHLAAKGNQEVTAERFIDLANLVMAYNAYTDFLASRGQDEDSVSRQGLVLTRRYLAAAQEGAAKFLKPIGERSEGSMLNPALILLERGGGPEVQIKNLAKVCERILPWLVSRGSAFRSIFTGKAAVAARAIASLVEEESIPSRLNKAAGIASVSGLSAPRKWIEKAAEMSGAALSASEGLAVSAQEAKHVAEEIKVVDSKLRAAGTNTPKAAELHETKANLTQKVDEIAASSADPAVVKAVALTEQSKAADYATDTGRRLKMTPDQEDAMTARGRVVIAAGAGSGKTRVLAGKVVYHMNELDVDASAVLASSFTTKASAELIKRIKDYGGVIEGQATDGFGTTHSIAGKILNTMGRQFRRQAYIGKKEGFKQTTLIRLAMIQVQMRGGAGLSAPEPTGLWADAIVPDNAIQGDPLFNGAVDDTIGYFEWALRVWDPKYQPWLRKSLDFLKDIYGTDPNRLSPSQRSYLNNLFSKVKRKGVNTITYRVGSKKKIQAARFDSETDEVGGGKVVDKMARYLYAKQPARQWFNLGLKLEGQEGKAAPTVGQFKNAISILKGRGISPSEAWYGEGLYGPESVEAAVYAAYEWLKGSTGEPDFQNHGDMDDILIDTVRAIVSSPQIRATLQARYKVILVDEAQDLNSVQHKLFGLIAGYIDPETLEPRADKKMSCDTFALIGDDKQAIYEFRGADPEEFIDKSDMTPGGDDFETKMLDTNFRSGRTIVDAANKLIAHNTKQIPMVCKANVERKGEGLIVSRNVEDTDEAAASVAEEIADHIRTAPEGQGKYAEYGIAVRSNAEAYAYGLEMLIRGIPFKSNANFFNDRNTKALIGWLTIAEYGLDGPPEKINPALLAAVAAPSSYLGPTFKAALESKATGNWAKWLADGGYRRIYSRQDMTETVEAFVANVKRAATFSGSPSDVINQVLTLTGKDGLDIRRAMIKAVEDDDEVMTSLAAESDDGTISQEMIEDHALAPIAPLIGLMRNQEDLGEAMAYVRKLQTVNDKLASKDTADEVDRDAVTISTMHGWKGLEVPNLYLPMVGGKFPRCPVSRNLEGQIEMDPTAPEGPALWSERRLAYVAITRAENRCVVLNIPHPKFGVRSQFIDEACIVSESSVTPEDEAGATKLGAASKWSADVLRALAAEAPPGFFDLDVTWENDPSIEEEWDALALDPLEAEWEAL